MEIIPLGMEHFPSTNQLYRDVTRDLRKSGIYQWDFFYPNRFIIKSDLKTGNFFGITKDNGVIGAIVIDNKRNEKYENFSWSEPAESSLIIHRLAVHPLSQGKGLGKKLLAYAEEHAMESGFKGIRLDVFSNNPGAVMLYERAGYEERGSVHYPFRKALYKCYEKVLTKK